MVVGVILLVDPVHEMVESTFCRDDPESLIRLAQLAGSVEPVPGTALIATLKAVMADVAPSPVAVPVQPVPLPLDAMATGPGDAYAVVGNEFTAGMVSVVVAFQ